MSGFQLFGLPHLTALVTIAAVAVAMSWWLGQAPARRGWLRVALATVLLGATLGYLALEALAGTPWSSIAPLHLCDIAVFIGTYALITRQQVAYELLYFWGCAGTVAALVTPELGDGFPHYRFIGYFLQHGAVVVAAVVLTAGEGMAPERRGPLRAWLWLNGYALIIALVNYGFGTNFLYLCGTPGAASPLDWLGPWPWYLLPCEGLALALFYLLALPLRRPRTGEVG